MKRKEKKEGFFFLHYTHDAQQRTSFSFRVFAKEVVNEKKRKGGKWELASEKTANSTY